MAHHVIRHLKRLATIKYILSLCTDQHKNNKQSTEKHVFYVLRCLQIKYYCKLVKAAFFTFINLDNEKTVFFSFLLLLLLLFSLCVNIQLCVIFFVWFFSFSFPFRYQFHFRNTATTTTSTCQTKTFFHQSIGRQFYAL